VIVNLALFFAWHVLWPQGWQGGIDPWAALLIAAATAALLRARRSVIEVILAGALLGLLLHAVLPLAGVPR
jgi:chromate transporter